MTPDERAALREHYAHLHRGGGPDILRLLDALDAETARADAAEGKNYWWAKANDATRERGDARAGVDRLTGALGAIAALPSASKPVRDIARDALLDIRL